MIDLPPYVLAIVLLSFPIIQIIAMAEDAWRMTISNPLALTLLIGFAVIALIGPMTLTEFYFRLALGVGLFALGTLGFAKNMLGGGDVKFLAASSLWIYPLDAPLFLFVMAISGGILGLIIKGYRYFKLPSPFGLAWLDHSEDQMGIPYGLAIGAAGLWAFSQSKTFQPFWELL